MEYHLIPHSLPGHPDCKTIRIIYSISPGIQVSLPLDGAIHDCNFECLWVKCCTRKNLLPVLVPVLRLTPPAPPSPPLFLIFCILPAFFVYTQCRLHPPLPYLHKELHFGALFHTLRLSANSMNLRFFFRIHIKCPHSFLCLCNNPVCISFISTSPLTV